MHHKRPLISAACAVFVLITVSAHTAEQPNYLTEVPDWALGSLAFSQIHSSLDKAGTFAGKILPNSGEIAKQFIMSNVFNLPVSAGIKDGPAVVFMLDPVSTGLRQETAFILPVADAAIVKKDMIDVFGAPTTDGDTMTFTQLQPPPKPDKTLLIKFVKDQLIAAPNQTILKKLDALVSQALPGSADPLPDARIALKVGTFKKVFQGLLELSMMQGVEMAAQDPNQSEKLKAQVKDALEMLWQVDTLEAHLHLAEAGAKVSLELQARPLAHSALAAQFEKPATPTNGEMLHLLPPDSPITATWNLDGVPLISMLQAQLDAESRNNAAQTELPRAILDVLKFADGEGALCFCGKEGTGTSVGVAVKVSDPAKATANLRLAFEKVKPGVNLKLLPEDEESGTAIQRYRVPSAKDPAFIEYAVVGGDLLASAGTSEIGTVKTSIDYAKSKNLPAQPVSVQSDCCAMIDLRLASLARLVLTNLPDVNKLVDIKATTAGVPNTPLTVSIRQNARLAGLRIDLPADTALSAFMLYQRLQGLLGSMKTAPDTAPAPPAP